MKNAMITAVYVFALALIGAVSAMGGLLMAQLIR